MERVVAAGSMMAVAAVASFLLLEAAPGDPATIMAGEFATPVQIAALRVSLGLDQPLWARFSQWAARTLTGDLGHSAFTGQPVTMLIRQRLEPTLVIAAFAMLIGVPVGVGLGAIAAKRVGGLADRLAGGAAVLILSFPVFLIGYAMSYCFAIRPGWFPVQGYISWSEDVQSWLRGLLLPTVSLAIPVAALLMRITRVSVAQAMEENCIRTGRANGLRTRTLLGHALRMSASTIVGMAGVCMVVLLSGSVTIESVFGIPGLGSLAVDAVRRHDYAVLQGVVLTSSAAGVCVHFVVDFLSSRLDPRLRK